MKKPTKKQQNFIDAYVKTGNAAAAARKAGYSRKNARIIGWQLARKPHIRRILARRLQEAEKNRIAEAREVLIRLTAIMRGEMPEPVTVTVGIGRGLSRAVTIWKRPAIRDRIRAAEALMRRYGLDMSDIEQKERRARIAAGKKGPRADSVIIVDHIPEIWYNRFSSKTNKKHEYRPAGR